jgi:hemerythrin-like domain-containing protein
MAFNAEGAGSAAGTPTVDLQKEKPKMVDALQMLRDDHRHVKDLFKQFEEADDRRAKSQIVAETLTALDLYAKLEEEIFYPAVRKEADPDDGEMDEAEEEHHVAKLLIGELRRMEPGAARYDAKFTVLAENVKRHIDEEEAEMLPKAAELGMQRLNELGTAMEKRKLQLMNGSARKSKPRTPAASAASGKRPAVRRKTATRPTATPTRNARAASKSASAGRAKAGTRATTRKKASSLARR